MQMWVLRLFGYEVKLKIYAVIVKSLDSFRRTLLTVSPENKRALITID